jgi:hypothetical protein
MNVEVETGDLVAHASHLDGLVERLNTALSAADTAMDSEAYGLLCAFLPPIISPTGDQAKDTIQAALEGIQTTSDNVRAAATAYDEGDKSNAQPFVRQEANSASPRISA